VRFTLPFFLTAIFAVLIVGGCKKRSAEDQLIVASGEGNIAEIQRLLAAGVNVNCRSPTLLDKSTPLIWAVAERQPEAVKVLLAAGADPNMRDAHKNAPLFYASSSDEGGSGITRALILGGADTEQYKSMYEDFLLPTNANRIAFEEAIQLRSNKAPKGSISPTKEHSTNEAQETHSGQQLPR